MIRPCHFIALLCSALPVVPLAQNKVNPDALILQDFTRRIADYVSLHNTVGSEIHRLKPTKSPEAIERYQHRFAHRLSEARAGVAQGNIFTPEIAAEFRRLIGIAMQGPGAGRIRESLQHAAPVRLKAIRVNHEYPAGVPLQSTPPSLLSNLPLLPPEVEYRVVGRDLVLRDVDANLIVDFVSNAIL
jgi:hypothetical protein